MTRQLTVTSVVLAALVLFSCQKSARPAASPGAGAAGAAPPGAVAAQDAAPPTPAPPAAGAGAASAPAAAPTAGPAAPAAGRNAGAPSQAPAGPGAAAGGIALQPQPAAAAPRSLANAGSLVALGRDARVLPEDFKIGPLGDALATDKAQDQAMEAAGLFLTSLVGGKVNTDLVAGDARDSMAGMLGFGLSQAAAPTSWRLGRPRTRPDGEVTAAVRLFSADGSSEGEIYVAQSGSRWLVTDLQISLAQLSVKTDKPKEKFFPLDYRWLLEE